MTVRHPSRRRGVVAITIVAVVVAAMAAVVLSSRGTPDPQPTPVVPTEAPLRPEPTLLVQLRDDTFTNVGNVLVGLGENSGAQLLLPHQLVIGLAGVEQRTLGTTGSSPIQLAPQLVGDQLGAAVDGALVLDRLAFAGLVDAIGGVTVQVPQTLVVKDQFGSTTTVIPAGDQALDGPEAALYASYRGVGEDPQLQLDRFATVWAEVLKGLPAAPDRMRAILGSLGALARSTQPIGPLAQFLSAAGDRARGQEWRTEQIAERLGAVGPRLISWPAPGPVAEQVASLFPAAQVDPAAMPVRVRVYGAGATPTELDDLQAGWDNAASTFVWSGPWFRLEDSAVIVADEDFVAQGLTVAAQAGVVPAVVTVDPAATPGAPITLFYVGPVLLDRAAAATPEAGVSSS